MRKFFITIGPRNAPRLAFEAIACDGMTAVSQHEELAEPGERVEVSPMPSEEELLAADLAYLLNQEARERRRVSEAAQLERAFNERRGGY